ncbi:hypothetical protein [Desulfobacter postgatei]|jgi:simple sugar transport system substrate-binding protein|uniref:hypothetical protein n=1 Tax=Desulfobacter postgatei TaxID=2293 RepID=UPI002A3683F8|nr:hypothetical protein [Desulfobacter postgatei]MDX9965245.1 hypothetical protein [Desulfobacter postgatei]
MDWGGLYAKILKDIHEGTWDPSQDVWWLAKEKAAILGGSPDEAINTKFKEGERASKDDLLSMMYFVDNVKGEIPNN